MKRILYFFAQVFYNVVFFAFFLTTGIYFLWRLWRRGRLLPQFGQRLGIYTREVRAQFTEPIDIWFHAVSVGEAMIVQVLLAKLRKLEPGLRVVITTTTATGYKVAKRLEDESTRVLYNPVDFLWSVVQAFRLFRPRCLVLIEAEIWPNYLWCARRRHIPVYLVNARLSRRTEERYHQLRWIVRPLLRELSLVFAQDPTDVDRLTRAGFAAETIFNLGSFKYDVAALDPLHAVDLTWWHRIGWNSEHLVLLGGSTHPGEEEVLARIFRDLRLKFPHLRLALAPRHAERGISVRNVCRNLGLETVLRSTIGSELTSIDPAPEVVVINSTGELRSLYAKAQVVFVGKSLRGTGGQNFIEAARAGAAIVVGPNMQNFEIATRAFLFNQAIVQVSDEFELLQKIHDLVRSPVWREQLGNRARNTFAENLNAAEPTARILLEALKAKSQVPQARY